MVVVFGAVGNHRSPNRLLRSVRDPTCCAQNRQCAFKALLCICICIGRKCRGFVDTVETCRCSRNRQKVSRIDNDRHFCFMWNSRHALILAHKKSPSLTTGAPTLGQQDRRELPAKRTLDLTGSLHRPKEVARCKPAGSRETGRGPEIATAGLDHMAATCVQPAFQAGSQKRAQAALPTRTSQGRCRAATATHG